MPFFIERNDITKMKVDVIVNSTNTSLQQGGGACGAIFKAAGAKELQAECNNIGELNLGDAVITKGYNLPAKYIIHTAGPIWDSNSSNKHELLYNSYNNSLRLAQEYKCESIAFPLISSGIYGCPKELALSISKNAILDFLKTNDITAYLVVYDEASYKLSTRLSSNIQSYIDDNYIHEHLIKRKSKKLYQGEMICEDTCKSEASYPQFPQPIRNISDLLKNLDETFTEMLLRLIDENDMNDVEVYKIANISRKLFSKIRNNKEYKPSKPTAIAFAIALKLNYDTTIDLLKKAGFALSHSNKFDIIIEYFVINEIYDIFEINETLFEFDQILLGR